jgi:hypothetical protein
MNATNATAPAEAEAATHCGDAPLGWRGRHTLPKGCRWPQAVVDLEASLSALGAIDSLYALDTLSYDELRLVGRATGADPTYKVSADPRNNGGALG